MKHERIDHRKYIPENCIKQEKRNTKKGFFAFNTRFSVLYWKSHRLGH